MKNFFIPDAKRCRSLCRTVLTAVLLVLAGCALPTAPPYPHHGPYGTREGVIAEAERQSQALEQYVKDVLDGKQPSEIPEKLLPVGREKELKNQKWYVQREAEIVPARQWIVRERSGVNFAASPGTTNAAEPKDRIPCQEPRRIEASAM